MTLIFLVVFAVSTASAVNFEMFKEHSFQDLAYQQNVEELTSCHNIKDYAKGPVKSARVDTCVIMYEQKHCEGFSVKVRAPGNPNLRDAGNIGSFHICNETQRGDVIKADLYSDNDLIMEYADICSCQNLLSEVTDKLNRINNYGNCISIYPSKDCMGNGLEVDAGKNSLSEHVNRDFPPMSISACGKRPSCFKFKAEIYKFDLSFPDNPDKYLKTIEMGEKTRFFNNGSGTVIQQYDSSKILHQTFIVSRSEVIAGMESSFTDPNFQLNVESDPDFSFGLIFLQIRNALKIAYTFNLSTKFMNLEKYEHSEVHTFSAKETVNIPPCVEYELFPTLQMYENIPMSVKLYAKISGIGSGQPIPVKKLKELITEMEFIDSAEQTQFTARFKSRESKIIKATFGILTSIQGEGKKLEGCALAMRQDICQNLNSYALGKFKGIYRSTCCN